MTLAGFPGSSFALAASLLLFLSPLNDALADYAEQAWAGLLQEHYVGRPEFAYVRNDPELPNILVYGDSISIQYTQALRHRLYGQANVYRLHVNGGDSGSFIGKMSTLHDTMRDPALDGHWEFDWDVIHFNVGLHDLKYIHEGKLDLEHGKQVTPIGQYKENLREIIEWLQQSFPSARLVFATTTPVPEGAKGRRPGDAARYNLAALEVLGDYPEIAINDLYALTLPNQPAWWQLPGNVHYNEAGRAAQGSQVARVVAGQLGFELKERPNILFIMSDDHTAQAIGAYGGRLASLDPTPTIDSLAEQGTRFDNVFVTNSICTPSRASIITGQYSQSNGVLDLDGSIDGARQHLPRLMSEAGYETAMIGKWHLKKEPEAFDYYKVLPGQGKYFDPVFRDIDAQGKWPKNTVQHEGHSSDVITDLSIRWLSERDRGRPFFLMHHYKAPHDMFENAPRYDDYLADVTIPEPANLYEQPEWGSVATRGEKDSMRNEIGTSVSKRNPRRNMGMHMGVDPDLPDDEYTRESYQRYLKRYLRTVKGVDDNLARLFDYLESSGQWDNTVIIYTGDQGMLLGEHDLIDKRWMWEESLRMPFIVRHPHKTRAPGSSDLIINNTDFAPLMLEIAGVETPDFMQGRSFAAVLDGKQPEDWRSASYYRYWMHRAHHDVPAHFGLRNDRYKLIFFYGAHYDATPVQSDVVYAGKNWSRKDGVIPSKTPTPAGWEFYDLEKDPAEVHNRYGDPAYLETIRSMKHELIRQREQLNETDSAYPHIQAIIDTHWDDR